MSFRIPFRNTRGEYGIVNKVVTGFLTTRQLVRLVGQETITFKKRSKLCKVVELSVG